MTATYTYARRLPFPAADNQSACLRCRTALLLQCNEAGRAAALVVVGPQLVRDFPLLEAVLRQPRIGREDGAVDMVGCAREIVRRTHQRAQGWNHIIFNIGTEVF